MLGHRQASTIYTGRLYMIADGWMPGIVLRDLQLSHTWWLEMSFVHNNRVEHNFATEVMSKRCQNM